MAWKGFLYILSHPYGIPSFKDVPKNIQLDKFKRKLLFQNVKTFWIGS